MTDRIMALAAAMLLAATLAACTTDDKGQQDVKPENRPGSTITQPDPGTDAGDDTAEGRARQKDRALAASLTTLVRDRLAQEQH